MLPAFRFACAHDPRFTAKNILAEINRNYHLPWFDTQLYRFVIIPITRMALRKQARQNAWMDTRPDWGRGRIDPFNPVKFGFLKLPVDDTIGNSDMEPVWNQKPRQGMLLHWDGLNTNHTEVVLSSSAWRRGYQKVGGSRFSELAKRFQPKRLISHGSSSLEVSISRRSASSRRRENHLRPELRLVPCLWPRAYRNGHPSQ